MRRDRSAAGDAAEEAAMHEHMARFAVRTILSAMVAGAVATAPAASQVLRGTVSEELTGRLLVGVDVLVVDSAGRAVATTRSAADGTFAVACPEPGRYALVAQGAGFQELRSGLMEVAADQTLDVSLELLPQATPIPGLEVTVDQLEQTRLELANRGVLLDDLGPRFIDEATIDRRMGSRDIGDLIEQRGIPGVWFVRPENFWASGAGDRWLCVTMVRARTGAGNTRCALVLLDGRRVDWNAISDIPGHELKAIAVLQPTEATLVYGTAGGAGAILLFTK